MASVVSGWTDIQSILDHIPARRPDTRKIDVDKLILPLAMLGDEICCAFSELKDAVETAFRGDTVVSGETLTKRVGVLQKLHSTVRLELEGDLEEAAAEGDPSTDSYLGLLAGLLLQRWQLYDTYHKEMLAVVGAWVGEVRETVDAQERAVYEKVHRMQAACSDWVESHKTARPSARLARKREALDALWSDVVRVASASQPQIEAASGMLLERGKSSLPVRIGHGLRLLEGGASQCLVAPREHALAERRVLDLEQGIQDTYTRLEDLHSRSRQLFVPADRRDPRVRVEEMRALERDSHTLRLRLRELMGRRRSRRDTLFRLVAGSQARAGRAAPEGTKAHADIAGLLGSLLKAATAVGAAERETRMRDLELEQTARSEVGARSMESFEALSEWLAGYAGGLGELTLSRLRETAERLEAQQGSLHQDIAYVLERVPRESADPLYRRFARDMCRSQATRIEEFVRVLVSGIELVELRAVPAA